MRIKTFKLFESPFIINVTDEEQNYVNQMKVKKSDSFSIFSSEEKKFVEEYGFTQDIYNRYFLQITDGDTVLATVYIQKWAISQNNLHYYFALNSGDNQNQLATDSIQCDTTYDITERSKIFRKLMLSLYTSLKEYDLDEAGIEKRKIIREESLKKQEAMKDIDPYGEEQWDDDQPEHLRMSARPADPPPPIQQAQPERKKHKWWKGGHSFPG